MTRLSRKDSASLRSYEDRLERENEDRLLEQDEEEEEEEQAEMNLYLIRGLPGSGKDTLAARFKGPGLAPSSVVRIHSADDFFMSQAGLNVWEREYQFNPDELPQAHKACQEDCDASLEDVYDVAVCNTFSCRWEMEPYLKMAKETEGVNVTVIDLFDAGLTDEELAERNIHDVPVENIAAMRERWEFDWKNGNPLPPWER